MKRFFLPLLLLASCSLTHAAVTRPAPEFSFPGPGNKTQTLRSLRGQPVVLLIADSPREGAFKKQLRYLREIYQQFASRQVVFAVAFRNPGDGSVQSNIPFAIINNGAAVAGAYGVQDDFNLVVIGKDGNVDYQTRKIATAERVRDVIQNSFEVQSAARKAAVTP